MGVDRVRWGIVATGNISTSFTRDLKLLADDAEVTAVASRSQTSADRFAAEFGIEQGYGDYRRLIDSGTVDVIYIGTPHPQHYAVARAAEILRGSGVFVGTTIGFPHGGHATR